MISVKKKLRKNNLLEEYEKNESVIVKQTSKECAQAIVKINNEMIFLVEISINFCLDENERVFLIKKNKWENMKNSNLWNSKLKDNNE